MLFQIVNGHKADECMSTIMILHWPAVSSTASSSHVMSQSLLEWLQYVSHGL